MSMKASSQAINEMHRDIENAIKEITEISRIIQAASRATGEWNDAQSQQYTAVMQKAARATQAPVETLRAALPKLKQLEQAVENYAKVRFNG